MSGPKIVRIVTRDEMIAICQGLLAQLDAAITRWQWVGRRNDTIDAADISAVEARRTTLRGLLTNNRFGELQKELPLEIGYLQADMQSRLRQAAEAVRDARRAARRLASTAQSILDALAQAGIHVPDELRGTLVNATKGGPGGESACARAFALLHRSEDTSAVNERQRQIADALRQNEPSVSFAEWMASQPSTEGDAVLLRIDGAIASLVVLVGGAAAAPYQARAATLNAAATGNQGDLLADSLLLDLVGELKRREIDAQALAHLDELAAALARFESPTARELRTRIDAAIAASNVEQAAPLAALAIQALTAEQQTLAAAARRKAILKGLAGLGYEVTEGMSTAWVEQGRVVLRSAQRPGYGVEIGGGVQTERMQIRAVAIGDSTTPRDTVRDRDIETLWCADVTRLKAMLAEGGDTLAIERALPVGATPLKVIAADSDAAPADQVHNYRRLKSE